MEKSKKIINTLQTKNKQIQIQANNENNKKLNLIEIKKNEIKEKLLKLENKHIDMEVNYKKLIEKENSIKKLIENNSDILNRQETLINSKEFNYLILTI